MTDVLTVDWLMVGVYNNKNNNRIQSSLLY